MSEVREDVTAEKVCELYFNQQKTLKEVAEELKCSIPTVRDRLRQSRRGLRQGGPPSRQEVQELQQEMRALRQRVRILETRPQGTIWPPD